MDTRQTRFLTGKLLEERGDGSDTPWGRDSSVSNVSGSLSCVMQSHGFDPPLGTFSGRGDFSLEVNMGSDSIPPKLFRVRV